MLFEAFPVPFFAIALRVCVCSQFITYAFWLLSYYSVAIENESNGANFIYATNNIQSLSKIFVCLLIVFTPYDCFLYDGV